MQSFDHNFADSKAAKACTFKLQILKFSYAQTLRLYALDHLAVVNWEFRIKQYRDPAVLKTDLNC